MKAKKNKRSPILVIILILLIAVFGVILYKMFFSNSLSEIKTIDKIEKYNYTLNSNATQYQKELFSDLKKILIKNPVDQEEYAKKVSQVFITDLFTLSNKMTNSDIGGLDYIYTDFKNDFISIAQHGMYKNVKNNLYKKRNQVLPEVKKVEVTDIKKDTFSYNGKKYPSYITISNISYKTSLGYPESYKLIIIESNNKLEIAKGLENK